MQPLIEELLTAGYHCQLRHVDEETNWEDVTKHGYVALFDGDARPLAKRDGFQHNRKLRAGGAWDTEALKELVQEATAAIEKKPPAASA